MLNDWGRCVCVGGGGVFVESGVLLAITRPSF